MAYILAVTWVAKAGKEDEVHEILQVLGEASRQEKAVIDYVTHVDADDPRQFFIYEVYDDASGLEAHQQTAHFKELVLQKALPLLDSRIRRNYVSFRPGD